MKTLITRKLGMTSTIADDGTVSAITLLSATPNVVTQIKQADVHGYSSVQLGFEAAKANRVAKAQVGHCKASGMLPKIIREFRLKETPEDLQVGAKLNPEVFSVGDTVDATGISKGKGWAGTIKRHNFQRGRKTHGGRSYRRVGSIGSMYPQKIFKGKRMAGHLGTDRVTIKRLTIALVDAEHQVIGVSGAVPGPRRSIVLLKEATS